MNDYLKCYKIKLTTASPVHIGSGKTLNKKEYIYNYNEKRVYIPDEIKMLNYFKGKNLLKQFENYLLNDFSDFSAWLKNNGISKAEYQTFCKYSLNAEDISFANSRTKEINTIIKDACGNPYIPGSSLKGAIRTALLSAIMSNKESVQSNTIRDFNSVNFNSKYASKDYSNIATEIEKNKFFKDVADVDSDKSEKRDVFQGLKISDSKALSVDCLTLTQKIDEKVNGDANALPTLRESIKLNTEIEFDLTIDTSIFKYSVETILKAIRINNKNYNVYFEKYFPSGKPLEQNEIFIGGGTGYISKTIALALFKDDVNSIRKIVHSSSKPQDKHLMDKPVSPRTLKLTNYNRTKLEMGRCFIEIV